MRMWIRCAFLAGLCIVIGCGETKNSPNPIPTPTPVDSGTPTPLPIPAPDADSRIPDLSGAFPLALTNGTSALKALAQNVFPPLVGDPLISLTIDQTREVSIAGNILFAFEDQLGFWGAELPSFTGLQSDSLIDILFADDEFVLRVVAERKVDDLSGILYYRLRLAGDTACRETFVTCEESPFGFSFPPYCYSRPDTATPCRAYMNLAQASVKSVGSFKAKYSKWAVKGASAQ